MILFTFAFVVAASCVASAETTRMIGETLVLIGTTPGNLCFDRIVPGSVSVRSAYDPVKAGATVYESGRDYLVDCAKGTIARTSESRIPDFQTNTLFGKKEFDHNLFPGFGNGAHFIYVDYTTENGTPLFQPTEQAGKLKQTRERREKGGTFKVINYGDSITTGGEASDERLQFTRRYAQ